MTSRTKKLLALAKANNPRPCILRSGRKIDGNIYDKTGNMFENIHVSNIRNFYFTVKIPCLKKTKKKVSNIKTGKCTLASDLYRALCFINLSLFTYLKL